MTERNILTYDTYESMVYYLKNHGLEKKSGDLENGETEVWQGPDTYPVKVYRSNGKVVREIIRDT